MNQLFIVVLDHFNHTSVYLIVKHLEQNLLPASLLRLSADARTNVGHQTPSGDYEYGAGSFAFNPLWTNC